jgi:hypothetical protein
MDRIYTVYDSDVDLFKQYAEKNNFWWKTKQNMDNYTSVTNGSEVISNPNIVVSLQSGDFYEYPYLDTMCYLNRDLDTLTNFEDDDSDRILKNTDGSCEYI